MTILKGLILFSFLVTTTVTSAKSYMIFSIMHELPMTNDQRELKKNYYINLGEKQGVNNGTTLNVYRHMTQNDPYKSKTRYNYRVKIGELEVIHQDDNSSIAVSKKFIEGEKKPFFNIPSFMVGDKVKVKIN